MFRRLAAGQFHGTLLRKHALGRLLLTESVYPAHSRVAKHAHDQPYCGFLLNGSYQEAYGSATRECHRSTLVFHPAGEVHSEQFGAEGCHLFRFELEATCLDHLRQYSRVMDEPATHRGGLLAQLTSRLYQEFRHPDDLAPLAIEGLVFELLAESARKSRRPMPGRPPTWLKQARELLHSSLAQKLHLETIAKTIGVHPVHLIRTFRRYYGSTPADYVRQLRIEFARRMLSSTSLPLADIALSAGFVDQSHFSRAFRRVTGTTPGAFRSRGNS